MATDWSAVTKQYNELRTEEYIQVAVYAPSLNKTLQVVIPQDGIEDFMNRLPLFEAKVTNGADAKFYEPETKELRGE